MYAPINNFNNLLLKTVRSRKWTCARGPCNKGARAEGVLAGGTARRCEAGPQPPDTGGGGRTVPPQGTDDHRLGIRPQMQREEGQDPTTTTKDRSGGKHAHVPKALERARNTFSLTYKFYF